MMLTCILVASYPQIDVLCLHFVEQRKDTIPSHDLPIEVVRLECFKLCVAIFTIDLNVLVLAKLDEFGRIDVLWWILKLLFTYIPAVSEQISVHVRIHFNDDLFR